MPAATSRMNITRRQVEIDGNSVSVVFPTRSEIDALDVDDFAPSFNGIPRRVVDIRFRGFDPEGRAFVGFMTEFSQGCNVSNTLKESTVGRFACSPHTSAQIDHVENNLRAAELETWNRDA